MAACCSPTHSSNIIPGVSYRPWLEERALRQMGNLPAEALDVLVRALVRICEDPYDRLFSMAVRAEDPQERMAELGDFGFIEFRVDEAAGLVHVLTVVWAGLPRPRGRHAQPPVGTRLRVQRSLRVLEQCPRIGRQLEGRWAPMRVILGRGGGC